MQEFYRLCGIRKARAHGLTQVELDRSRYPRGRSQIIDTEFSFTEFGSEADRQERFSHPPERCRGRTIRRFRRRDAFFAAVKHPVETAAAMSAKMLEAQRARSCSQGNATPAVEP